MSKRATNLNLASPQLRTRVAVLAAGLGASAMLGVGVASAATGADTAPGAAAGAVAAQADAQSKAATAVKHAEQSKKEAPKGKPAEKKAEKKPESKPAKKKSAWTIPVNDATISATYGTGGDRWANKHSGQDYAVSVGTDVHSAMRRHDSSRPVATVPVTAPPTATPSSSSTPTTRSPSTRTCRRST